jgi:K+-dependent Na+/Ca+ exchanger-like protein
MTAAISLIIILFCVYLLIIISNDFFIESLDQISGRLKLSPSVAGATLMAAGSSAPELAIALLALFTHGGAHSDVGIGTIVGSAVFNILVITGLCAVIKPAEVTISAIVRDTAFYLTSILLLVYVFLDGTVTLWEPLLLIGTYLAYLLALYYLPGDVFQEPHVATTLDQPLRKPIFSWRDIFRLIDGGIKKAIRVLAGDACRNYLRSFTVSIAAIIVISKLLVDSAIILAEALHIPPVIVALTVLACGTSAPDLI